jgi:luciferase family oxidoreductase group 1
MALPRAPSRAPLSVSALDLSPITSGASASDALRNTIDLAQHAERLGFERYWLAEHHNAGGLASSSPEILIGLVAQATKTIRVGSGGVMLPNHSPLKVAEWFRLLHALFPGRIDLGLGRAPGTDPQTARVLRRSAAPAADDFVPLFDDLVGYLEEETSPRPDRGGRIRAIPTGVAPPALWILGSSDYGGAFAARRGLGFAFARHINPTDAVGVLRAYRAGFRPSAQVPGPHAILALSVICGETDDEAEVLASSVDLSMTRFLRGIRDLPLPSVEEARAYRYDSQEEALRLFHRDRHIIGGPRRVRDEILSLAQAAAADEVMIMTHIHSHEARKRSYELVAGALGVDRQSSGAKTEP